MSLSKYILLRAFNRGLLSIFIEKEITHLLKIQEVFTIYRTYFWFIAKNMSTLSISKNSKHRFFDENHAFNNNWYAVN